MKNYISKLSAVALAATLVIGMTGCSDSASDSASDPVVVGDDEVTYTGTNSLSGSFETFASSSLSPARASRAVGDEIVKLYVLDENGALKDTGITCPVDGSSYTCSDIASNKEYIVRYIKDNGDGTVLEMKSNVALGTTPVENVEVSRVTSLIVEAISKAVEEAVVGTAIDEAKITELIASIKESIVSAISTLVQQGLITIPTEADMIVSLTDGETFDDFAVTAEENTNLSDASGVIITDESVSNTLNSGKNDAKLDVYEAMTNAEIVREIFAQTGGDGDEMPDWVIDFLAAKYNATSTEYTVESFLAKLEFKSRAIEDDGSWNPEAYFEKQLEGAGVAPADQQALVTGVLSDLNTSVTSGTVITSLKTMIAEHYTLKAKTDKTPEDYKKLGDFPPIIEFLFSETQANALEATTPIANMGQGIILIIYIEEVLTSEIIFDRVSALVGAANVFEDQVRNIRMVESDPMFLFTDFGFASEIATYDALSVGYFEAKTDKSWNQSTGTEIEYLSVKADVEKPSWMFVPDSAPVAGDITATLTYPIVGGTDSVDLVVSVSDDGVGLSYSAWDCDNTGCTEDTSKMDITDNISGDYVLTVSDGTDTVTKTFNKFILKGANDVRAKLLSPSEKPEWPEELNDQSIDWSVALPTDLQTLMTDFNTAKQNYQITTFATNNLAEDAVEDVVFKWDDSALNDQVSELALPENIVVAYQVGINLRDTVCEETFYTDGGEGDSWEACNTEIYNTWWNNKAITATSFKLPVALRATTNTEKYNIGVNVVFLDKDTGREVGQGGHSWAEFQVGTAAILNGDESVNFTGTITAEEGSTVPATMKVALMSEECTFNATTFVHDCLRDIISIVAPTAGAYSLDVNVTDIKAAMGTNGHISIVAFDDLSDFGVFNDWDPAIGADNANAEPIWWPQNTNFWFENWGDFRVGSSTYDETTGDYTHSTQQIVPGVDVNVTGIDFKVYNYN